MTQIDGKVDDQDIRECASNLGSLIGASVDNHEAVVRLTMNQFGKLLQDRADVVLFFVGGNESHDFSGLDGGVVRVEALHRLRDRK